MPFKKFSISNFRFSIGSKGYSLIELLIVISIFGITVSLVTASYLSFERNQKFKNAALQLKSDIRYMQNKALTGDKSLAGCIDSQSALIGWYLNVSTGAASGYSLFSDCLGGGNETSNLLNNAAISLPRGVTICRIVANNIQKNDMNILFRPVSSTTNVYFFQASLPTPPFLLNGVLKATQETPPIGIYLTNGTAVCATVGTYKVVVQANGEVNEVRLTTNE
ncbi:prepilin-type N-terminal cleavage/methylation domain-containing protein [Candidatus Curtissbacteria bacterium]|nr:prepilin-type N-terminal cleavage/methylation domain-containing protein [Candidatus Curtissbacteria bacterium]